jgi:hypothetical protein
MAIVTRLGVFPIVAVIFSLFGHWLNLLPTLGCLARVGRLRCSADLSSEVRICDELETLSDSPFADPAGLVCIPQSTSKEQHMANIAVGERFPAFILPDEQGEPFDLRSELADGPLMLVFYRGDW